MNKLIFLGTGSAANTERQMTALCFVAGSKSFLIDCGDGMGSVRNLLKAGVDLESVNDVFITHRHADHILGLPHFLFLKLIHNLPNRVNVYGSKEALSTVKLIAFKTHDYVRNQAGRISFIPLISGQSIRLGEKCIVTPEKYPKQKGIPTTHAYKVQMGNKAIIFSSDTGPSEKLVELAESADILIHECFALESAENFPLYGHSTAKGAALTAAKAKVKQLILTHLQSESRVSSKQILEEAGRYYRGKLLLAADLLEITL